MTRIRKILLPALCVCALLGALPCAFVSAPRPARAAEPEEIAEVDGTPYTGFESALSAWTQGRTLRLLGDAETSPVTVSEEKTLDLNGYTLSLKEEETGSVLTVGGTGILTVEDSRGGGRITGGNALEGGGIFVDSRAALTVSGGEISGNTASKDGGGIYVTGQLTLSGDAAITDNTDGADNPSNIFLSHGNTIHADGFTGRAGISTADPAQSLTDGVYTGEFFSDDSNYIVRDGKFLIAPLASVTVTYEGTEKIFPTTSPSSLKGSLKVEGTNINGVPYGGEITLEFPAAGIFHVGECEVTVTAYGKGDLQAEPVTASFWVEVVSPRLESVDVSVSAYPLVYFDTPIEELQLTVTGKYEDGNSRTLGDSPEQTAKENPAEPFITDYYILSGSLAKREEGNATLTVTVGQLSENFSVAVSRHSLNAEDFSVNDVTVIGESGAEGISPEMFVQGLPAGIEAVPMIGGKPIAESGLTPGVYTVEISFLVEDVENYEVSGLRTATLTVNRASFDVTNDAQETVCSFTAEEGIPPAWKFTVKDVAEVRHPALEGDFEILQAQSLTLLREDEGKLGKICVRLLLGERARAEEDLLLYRVRGDGSLEEVAFTRDGDWLEFEGSEFLDTQYVIATDSGFGLYLALGITFGVLCAAAAAGFFCYLVFKRKMRIRE